VPVFREQGNRSAALTTYSGIRTRKQSVNWVIDPKQVAFFGVAAHVTVRIGGDGNVVAGWPELFALGADR
jgi:hypothetical protein